MDTIGGIYSARPEPVDLDIIRPHFLSLFKFAAATNVERCYLVIYPFLEELKVEIKRQGHRKAEPEAPYQPVGNEEIFRIQLGYSGSRSG